MLSLVLSLTEDILMPLLFRTWGGAYRVRWWKAGLLPETPTIVWTGHLKQVQIRGGETPFLATLRVGLSGSL